MEKCRIEDCEFCSYKKISEVYFLDDLGHMHECEKDYGYDGEY